MIRGLAHFIWHAPHTLRLKSRLSQAELYDCLAQKAEQAGMAEHRTQLVADLSGSVLEIGCGTGLMFEHYPAQTKITAIEPDPDFRDMAETAVSKASAAVSVHDAEVQALPFESCSFDAVVIALVLCSVESMGLALEEVRRVLRPGGSLRLIEHVRSERALPGALMTAFNPLWLRLNGQGCNMHRDPLGALHDADFAVDHVDPFEVYAPGFPAFPLRAIYARSPDS